MIRVIGLSGPAGCGKSTIARMLVNEFAAVPVGLADYFKVPAVAMDKLPVYEVFGPLRKSATTRHFLQQRGTEQGRDVHGDDVWIRHFDAHLYRLREMGVQRVVVDDVRFHNEAGYLLDRQFQMWKITGRGGLTGDAAQHRSERDLDAIPHDAEIANHGSLEWLWGVVSSLAATYWGPALAPVKESA